MKAILIAIVVSQAINSFGQDSIHTKQYYLHKSKNQKTTGIVLLAGGAALTTIGTIILFQDISDDYGGDSELESIMTAVGSTAMLVSIPFFISSGTNARRAAFVVGTQTLPQSMPYTIAVRRQPSIGVRINL